MIQPKMTIVGAGLAGLCTAHALLLRGAKVKVVDQADPGRGASWAAAGMLAPTFETATEGLDHPGMFNLLFQAAAFWRSWVSGGNHAPPAEVGYRSDPLIALAMTAGEAAAYERLTKFDRARDLTDEEWSKLKPFLAKDELKAFALPLDGQVDNRALVDWLIGDIRSRGGCFERRTLTNDQLRPQGLDCDLVVDARGWRVPGMTPVKGTAMSLAPHPGLPDRLARWGRNYLVPKRGRTILGAHAMSGLTDNSVDAAIIEELRAEAAEVFPAVLEADILETWSGVRPRARDGAPVLGWTGEGTYVVGGMYRDGVLLSPLLGHWAAAELCGEPLPEQALGFRWERFATALS